YTLEELAVSADGRRLAVGTKGREAGRGGEVLVYDTATGSEVLNLTGLGGHPHQLGYSPDGTRLATLDTTGKFLKLWDATTGQEVLTIGGVGAPMWLGFTTDGRLAVTEWTRLQVFDGRPE